MSNNLQISEFQLRGVFSETPEYLLEASRRMPIDNGYIPYAIFDRDFDLCTPTARSTGNAVVSISVGEPFGFMRKFNRNEIEGTQKTADVELEQADSGLWVARTRTEQPLTAGDIELFDLGLRLYSAMVRTKLDSLSTSQS